MSTQWGNIDNANNAPIWAATALNVEPTRTAANAMYDAANTTAVPGVQLQVKGYNAAERVGGSAHLELKSALVVLPGTAAVPNNVHGITGTGGTSSVVATIRELTTKVVSATVTRAGQGFANGDIVALDGDTDAFLVVTTNGSGNAASVAVQSGGVFTTNPSANSVTANNTGIGTLLNVTAVMGINTVEVAVAGDYTVAPTGVANNSLTGNSISNATVALSFGNIAGTDGDGIPSTGWVLERKFTGGRAGRIQNEVLVTGKING